MVMMILTAIGIFVPPLLAAHFISNLWYISATPIIILIAVVGVKGFDYIY